jgi:two-component system chemotaxis response regulator CheB
MSASGQTSDPGFELVVLVSSLGGLAPMATVLAGLPATFPVPLVIAQHSRSNDDPDRLSRLLQARTPLPVCTARTGMRIPARGVTVLPPMTVGVLSERHHLKLRDAAGVKVGDALFCSAAQVIGARIIAIVLSGMQRDGAKGVQAVKGHGGRVMAQDPATASSPEMPSAAIATGCVELVLSPHLLASALVALAMAPGASELLRVAAPPWAAGRSSVPEVSTTY